MTETASPLRPAHPDDREIVLRVEHLTKVFGRGARDAADQLARGADRATLPRGTTAAVIDAGFEVRRGEIFVVMGLSGSGKSTLIRMLNGLAEPTAGLVEIGGSRVDGASPRARREIRRSRGVDGVPARRAAAAPLGSISSWTDGLSTAYLLESKLEEAGYTVEHQELSDAGVLDATLA